MPLEELDAISRDRSRAIRLFVGAAIGVVLLVFGSVALLSQLGDNEQGANQAQQQDRSSGTPGSPEEAFLDYWASLQSQAWINATEIFDSGLVREIGERELLRTLKSQAPFYAAVEAKTTGVRPNKKGTTVQYVVTNSSDQRLALSTIWRREGGRWRLVYDAYLDTALAQYAHNQVQARINPTAKTPAPQAVRAGQEASEIQLDYLRRLKPQ